MGVRANVSFPMSVADAGTPGMLRGGQPAGSRRPAMNVSASETVKGKGKRLLMCCETRRLLALCAKLGASVRRKGRTVMLFARLRMGVGDGVESGTVWHAVASVGAGSPRAGCSCAAGASRAMSSILIRCGAEGPFCDGIVFVPRSRNGKVR